MDPSCGRDGGHRNRHATTPGTPRPGPYPQHCASQYPPASQAPQPEIWSGPWSTPRNCGHQKRGSHPTNDLPRVERPRPTSPPTTNTTMNPPAPARRPSTSNTPFQTTNTRWQRSDPTPMEPPRRTPDPRNNRWRQHQPPPRGRRIHQHPAISPLPPTFRLLRSSTRRRHLGTALPKWLTAAQAPTLKRDLARTRKATKPRLLPRHRHHRRQTPQRTPSHSVPNAACSSHPLPPPPPGAPTAPTIPTARVNLVPPAPAGPSAPRAMTPCTHPSRLEGAHCRPQQATTTCATAQRLRARGESHRTCPAPTTMDQHPCRATTTALLCRPPPSLSGILREAPLSENTCPPAPPRHRTSRYGLWTLPTGSRPQTNPDNQQQACRWIPPHSAAMTCSRLGGRHGSAGGTPDPCHCHLWTMPAHETALQAIDKALQTATRRLSPAGPRSRTLGSMLREMSMLALNRAHDRGTWTHTANHLVAVLTAIADLDPRDVDVPPPL